MLPVWQSSDHLVRWEFKATHIYQAARNFSPTFQVPKIRRSPVEFGSLSAQCFTGFYTWQVVVWDYFHHQQYFHVHLWFIVGGILFFRDHLDSYQVEVTKSYPTCYLVRLAVQREDSQRKKSQPYLLSLGYGRSGWGTCESERKAIEDGSIYVLSPVCVASCGGTCAWSLLMYYCFVSCVCCACI